MLANSIQHAPAFQWKMKQSNIVESGFLPRVRYPTAAMRSFNLSFPVGGEVCTPDTRIKFGQIEHISSIWVVGVGVFSLFFPIAATLGACDCIKIMLGAA